jgi:phenylalanine ammonia-lyase
MTAAVLYAACQAIDLRVMHATFLENFEPMLVETCGDLLLDHRSTDKLRMDIDLAVQALKDSWWRHASEDAANRCSLATSAFTTKLSQLAMTEATDVRYLQFDEVELRELQTNLNSSLLRAYELHRSTFFTQPTTENYMGRGTRAMYRFVRSELRVPMNRGLQDHPVFDGPPGKQLIGTHVSRIYEALQDGLLYREFARIGEAFCTEEKVPTLAKL